MWLFDRVIGRDLDRLDGPGLARAIRHGGEGVAVRAVLRLADRPEAQADVFIEALLDDSRPAIQQAALRALGRRARPDALPALRRYRTLRDELTVHHAVALVRLGDPAPLEHLRSRDARTLGTEGGRRRLAFDVPSLEERFTQERDDPAAFADVLAALPTAGRREQHVLLAALGRTGAPEALPLLVDALRATDVDPGRGFTQRRLCATAIGRLGLRDGARVVLRALDDEALDFEGRPGAGMGIQYPVRTNLLWALGEIGDPGTIPTLLSYLANTSGSAFGGFYLAAMDALWKFGPSVEGPLREVAHRGPDTAAAHAVGVLAALGLDVQGYRSDARRGVARVVREATA